MFLWVFCYLGFSQLIELLNNVIFNTLTNFLFYIFILFSLTLLVKERRRSARHELCTLLALVLSPNRAYALLLVYFHRPDEYEAIGIRD